jgi:hypothetical protein
VIGALNDLIYFRLWASPSFLVAADILLNNPDAGTTSSSVFIRTDRPGMSGVSQKWTSELAEPCGI